MGENHRVDHAHIGPQRLGAKIGASIDHEGGIRCLDVNGGTQPLIARVGRSTNVTMASDHRDALRRPGAEKGKDQPGTPFAKAFGALLANAFGVESWLMRV